MFDAAWILKNVLSTPCNLRIHKHMKTNRDYPAIMFYTCASLALRGFPSHLCMRQMCSHTCCDHEVGAVALVVLSKKKAPLPTTSGALGGFLGKFSTFTV